MNFKPLVCLLTCLIATSLLGAAGFPFNGDSPRYEVPACKALDLFAAKSGHIIRPTAGTLALQLARGSRNIEFDGELAGEAPPPEEPLSLWYRRPARQWVEALPIGNGRLAAMVFGGINSECLQLNEDTLWGGGPYDPNNPEALAALPEARRLIFEGKYKEAHKLIGEKMMAKPLGQMPYQPVGDLVLTFPEVKQVENYRRQLDLDTAIARVRYSANGVKFTREVFSSPVCRTAGRHGQGMPTAS